MTMERSISGDVAAPGDAPTDLAAVVENLKNAIARGNVEEACAAASALARSKAAVWMELDNAEPSNKHHPLYKVKIYIEDADNTAGPLIWDLRAAMKVRHLKRLLYKRRGFPVGSQRVIVGRYVAGDGDSLHKAGVVDGTTMYVYIAADPGRRSEDGPADRDIYQELDGSGGGGGDWRSQTLPTNRSMPEPQAEARLPTTLPRSRSDVGPSDHGIQFTELPPAGSTVGLTSGVDSPAGDMDSPAAGVEGWSCPKCTLVNPPLRPGCEACATDRPEDYTLPPGLDDGDMGGAYATLRSEEQEENYARLLAAEQADVVENREVFACPVCFDDVQPGAGVVLRECLHTVCRFCLADHIRLCDDPIVRCPFSDGTYNCSAAITMREIRKLVDEDTLSRHEARSLQLAESAAPNSFHCRTEDCRGWCLVEDNANFFICMVCKKRNCLTCAAIHDRQNCKEYQDELKVKAANDDAARQTKEAIDTLVAAGDAMPCPRCEVVVMKKSGCDWIECSMCRTEICWVTKGPRWGPRGRGDTSGGCKCGVDGKRCHNNCNNCH